MAGRLGVALAAVAATGALGATAVLAGGDDAGPGQTGSARLSATADRVSAPSIGGGRLARAGAAASEGARLVYLETPEPLTFQPGYAGATLKRCPGRSTVLNGYYFKPGVQQGFGLDDQGGSPARLRKWSFYLENETALPIEGVTLGMICLKRG